MNTTLALPELPDGSFAADFFGESEVFTADQMHAYARQAIAMSEKDWLPIESAPLDRNVLMEWRPIDCDKRPWHVEVVIAALSSHKPGMIWIGGRYQSVSHVTGWRELPVPNAAPSPTSEGK